MKTGNFITGMTAGLVVGSVASILVSNMNGKTRRQIKQTANRAVRAVGDITNTME